MKDLKEWLKILYKNLIYWGTLITVFIIIAGFFFGIRLYLGGGYTDCIFADDPVICKVIKEKGNN